jgi:hypothetical protein
VGALDAELPAAAGTAHGVVFVALLLPPQLPDPLRMHPLAASVGTSFAVVLATAREPLTEMVEP